MVKNRFIRLLIKDSPVKIRLVILLVIVSAGVVVWKQSKAAEKELAQLKEKQRLVAKLATMKQTLKGFNQQPLKTNFILNGIFIKDNTSFIISGDKQYSQGDSVGDYIIAKITANSVILVDKITKEMHEVFVQEKPPASLAP